MYNNDYSMTSPVDPFEEERKRREQEMLPSGQRPLSNS